MKLIPSNKLIVIKSKFYYYIIDPRWKWEDKVIGNSGDYCIIYHINFEKVKSFLDKYKIKYNYQFNWLVIDLKSCVVI